MLKQLTTIKERLSHIDARSWHWKAVEYIFGRKARGKACTYYWIKIPLSLLAYAGLAILTGIVHVCRIFWVGVMWVFGYRFNAKIFDIDESVLSNYNYNDYKEKPDGSRSRFAPWELLLIPACAWVLWMLAIQYPATGIKVLTWTAGIAGAVILIYFVTAAWKFPPIVRARAEVSNTWNRVCPPLVVEEAPLFEETAE